MKKLFGKLTAIAAIAALSLTLVAGCAPPGSIPFDAPQYEYTSASDETKTYPAARVVRSQHDLEQYCELNKLSAVEYDDEFFMDGYIVVVEASTASTAVKFEVKYVQWSEDNKILVTVIKSEHGDGATVAGTCFMFIGLSIDYEITDESSVTINIR